MPIFNDASGEVPLFSHTDSGADDPSGEGILVDHDELVLQKMGGDLWRYSNARWFPAQMSDWNNRFFSGVIRLEPVVDSMSFLRVCYDDSIWVFLDRHRVPTTDGCSLLSLTSGAHKVDIFLARRSSTSSSSLLIESNAFSPCVESSLTLAATGAPHPIPNLKGPDVTIAKVPLFGSLTHGISDDLLYTPNTDRASLNTDSFTVCTSEGVLHRITVFLLHKLASAPHVQDDFYQGDEDRPFSFDPRINDDQRETNIVFVSGGGPSHGTATLLDDLTVLYTPTPDFFGKDQMLYLACNQHECSAPAMITFDIRGTPDSPVASGGTLITPEDTSVPVSLQYYDPDGDPLDVSITDPPLHGSMSSNLREYIPFPDFSGLDQFSFKVCDSSGRCDEATIYITITAVNDAPVSVDLNVNIPVEVSSIQVALFETIWDADANLNQSSFWVEPSDVIAISSTGAVTVSGPVSVLYGACDLSGECTQSMLTVRGSPQKANFQVISINENSRLVLDMIPSGSVIKEPPKHGSVSQDRSSFIYIPTPNFVGRDRLMFADDILLLINVNNVEDGPVARDDVHNLAKGIPVFLNVLDNDSNGDNHLDPLSLKIISHPCRGTAALAPGGEAFVYTGGTMFNHVGDSFEYEISDTAGKSARATVRLHAHCVEDSQCADDNQCTREACVNNQCVVLHQLEPNSVECCEAADCSDSSFCSNDLCLPPVYDTVSGVLQIAPKCDTSPSCCKVPLMGWCELSSWPSDTWLRSLCSGDQCEYRRYAATWVLSGVCSSDSSAAVVDHQDFHGGFAPVSSLRRREVFASVRDTWLHLASLVIATDLNFNQRWGLNDETSVPHSVDASLSLSARSVLLSACPAVSSSCGVPEGTSIAPSEPQAFLDQAPELINRMTALLQGHSDGIPFCEPNTSQSRRRILEVEKTLESLPQQLFMMNEAGTGPSDTRWVLKRFNARRGGPFARFLGKDALHSVFAELYQNSENQTLVYVEFQTKEAALKHFVHMVVAIYLDDVELFIRSVSNGIVHPILWILRNEVIPSHEQLVVHLSDGTEIIAKQ